MYLVLSYAGGSAKKEYLDLSNLDKPDKTND